MITDKQFSEKEQFRNDLHDALINKYQTRFQRSWNNKFNKNKVTRTTIDGVTGNESIADQFAHYFDRFGKGHRDSSVLQNDLFQAELAEYTGSYINDNRLFNVESLDSIIDKNGKRKSSWCKWC